MSNPPKFVPNNRYKYDPVKEAKKYCHLSEFYHTLPSLRQDIQSTLANFDYSKEHIIYLILAIIDLCNFRIGNEKYKKSTGTATLKVNNVQACNTKSIDKCSDIKFVGKRQVLNECQILDEKINRILMKMTQYKDDNDFIFTYQNETGEHKITAQDVNELLKKYGDLSTKMFRTWKANYYFIKTLKKSELPETKKQLNKNVSLAVEAAAKKLHHTKNICRRSYIDSRIVNLYKESPQEFLEIVSNTSNTNPFILQGEEDVMKLLSFKCEM